MHRFFENELSLDDFNLSKSEEQHFKVLRIKHDEKIEIIDGKGSSLLGNFEIFKNSIVVKPIELTEHKKSTNELFMAVSLIQDKGRIEFLVEKLSEIGVDKIIFFRSDYSQKMSLNLDKLKLKSINAIKQSQNYFLPEILYLEKIEDLVKFTDNKKVLLADKNGTKFSNSQGSYLFMIGPEGGFSENDFNRFSQLFEHDKINLSENILRTETAAIVAAGLVQNGYKLDEMPASGLV